MSQTPPRVIPAHVLAAIENLNAFYQQGTQAPLRLRSTFNKKVIKKQADRLGVNEDTLRKSRAFANKKVGYTPKELKQLIDDLKSHDYGNRKWKLGQTHIIRLISVTKGEIRKELQDELIKKEWTCSKLDTAIRQKMGTQKVGGRRRRVPTGKKGVTNQVAQECDRLRRWWISLRTIPKRIIPADKTTVAKGPCPLHHLSQDIQEKLKEIVGSARDLLFLADKELAKRVWKKWDVGIIQHDDAAKLKASSSESNDPQVRKHRATKVQPARRKTDRA